MIEWRLGGAFLFLGGSEMVGENTSFGIYICLFLVWMRVGIHTG